jgi:hypothetical protein
MKKLFIGLLIIAAGTGAFFAFRKTRSKTIPVDQTLIIGSWKTIGSPGVDSVQSPVVYDFRKDGSVLIKGDSTQQDTSYYIWDKKGELLIKKSNVGSNGTSLRIVKLTGDTSQLANTNRDSLSFIRVK